MPSDGGHVARNRPPSADLSHIVGTTATQVVAAVPLKPAARILRPYPTAAPPHGERLRGIHAEEVQSRIAAFGAEPGAPEPAGGKLSATVGHVLAAEDAKLEHLFRRQLRTKRGRE